MRAGGAGAAAALELLNTPATALLERNRLRFI
jgi:hypothetical protein